LDGEDDEETLLLSACCSSFSERIRESFCESRGLPKSSFSATVEVSERVLEFMVAVYWKEDAEGSVEARRRRVKSGNLGTKP
jgi:hypothetical protein